MGSMESVSSKDINHMCHCIFTVLGFPHHSFDLCITDLYWLSIQISLELCNPNNDIFRLLLHISAVPPQKIRAFFISYHESSLVIMLSHLLPFVCHYYLCNLPLTGQLCLLALFPSYLSNTCITALARAFPSRDNFPDHHW